MWENDVDELVGELGDVERKLLMKDGSVLGSKWLQRIPYFQPLSLTDYYISAGLHYAPSSLAPLVPAGLTETEIVSATSRFANLGTDG